tara:strand:- start:177 stop:674 length:498 start_codon:yes stop_codon:yes gene_type:complete
MTLDLKKNFKFYSIIIFLLFLILSIYFLINKFQKEKTLALEPITINLLTSVHPNLSWNFSSIDSSINIKPGEVTTIEYIVENFGEKETTGIATFAYFPKQFGSYISKINCFCYDAQTLKPREKDTYTLVIFVDPKVTKDTKTKSIKEATIQFTFFDYKEYKKKEI